MDGLVKDWLDSPFDIDNRLLLVHDHADSQAISERIRAGLRDRGVLGAQEHVFDGRRDQRTYDMSVALGDRVRITKNDNALGVENGDMAQVEDIRKTATGSIALTLRVEGKRGDMSCAIDVDTATWNHLAHGYARTIHDAQGQGKPAVFHFANPKMVDNQAGLVAFTRLTSDRYRMYGAEVELEQTRNRLGADRLKQNATQEGLWRNLAAERAPTLVEDYEKQMATEKRRLGLQI